MESWWSDIRHGARLLRRSRAFATFAILSLAVGIGANSAIFSIADALLLRPLPYANADRIAILWQRSPGLNVTRDWLSPGQYLDIATENTAFETVAAAIGASYNLTGAGQPERIDGVKVSSSFFTLFGAKPLVGSPFTADDDVPGKKPSVLLMNGFWKRRFGSDPSVVGKTLTLNGITVTIAGVMATDFAFTKEVMPAVNGIQHADLLLPLPLPASARTIRDHEDYNVFAKRKPGVTFEQAEIEMAGIARRMQREYPENYPAAGGLTISVLPLIDQVVGDVRLALVVLLGAVGFVLLIACGNVANLLLSRAAVREREMSVRAAVGASRARMVRQLITESVLLAVAGGAVGLAAAAGSIWVIRHAGPANIPRLAEVGVDARMFGFTFVVSLAATLLFGLVPALRASHADPSTVLKGSARGTVGSGMRHGRLRKTLIVAELALSLVLLIGATLLIRSYARITDANPGFDPYNTLSLRLSLPPSKYRTPDAISAFYKQLNDRLTALPGVTAVGTNYQLPLSSVASAWEPIEIDGHVPKGPDNNLIISSSAYVSQDYFRTMGIPLVRGRTFAETDDRKAPPVVIVDENLAERFWPNQNAIGKRLRQGSDGPWRTVVGVVSTAKEYEANPSPPITAFFPVEQYAIGSRFVVVRTARSVDAASLTSAVTREIRRLDPDLPMYDVNTMLARVYDSLASRRLAMTLLATFAAIAMLLAAIGIYGVISYWVEQRTSEIGIRVALGAERADILRLVTRELSVMVAVGLAVGLAGAFALTRFLAGMLFGVSATDLMTFGGIPLVLAAVALVATLAPLRRATQIDPMVALHYE